MAVPMSALASAALAIALATPGAIRPDEPRTVPDGTPGSELLLEESDVGLAEVPTEVFLRFDSTVGALADPVWFVENADPSLRLWIGSPSEAMSGEPIAVGSEAAQIMVDNLIGTSDTAGCWVEPPPVSEAPLFRAFGGEEDAIFQIVLRFATDADAERFLAAWATYEGLVDDWDDSGFVWTVDDPSGEGSNVTHSTECGPLWAPPAEEGFEPATPCTSVALCWQANVGDDEYPSIAMAARRGRHVTVLGTRGSVDGERAMTAAVGHLDPDN